MACRKGPRECNAHRSNRSVEGLTRNDLTPTIKDKRRYQVIFGKAFNEFLLHRFLTPAVFFKVCLFLFLLLRAWLWCDSEGRAVLLILTSETVVLVSGVRAFLVCLDHTKANRFLTGGDLQSILSIFSCL